MTQPLAIATAKTGVAARARQTLQRSKLLTISPKMDFRLRWVPKL
jgi:hypothetical protein